MYLLCKQRVENNDCLVFIVVFVVVVSIINKLKNDKAMCDKCFCSQYYLFLSELMNDSSSANFLV